MSRSCCQPSKAFAASSGNSDAAYPLHQSTLVGCLRERRDAGQRLPHHHEISETRIGGWKGAGDYRTDGSRWPIHWGKPPRFQAETTGQTTGHFGCPGQRQPDRQPDTSDVRDKDNRTLEADNRTPQARQPDSSVPLTSEEHLTNLL